MNVRSSEEKLENRIICPVHFFMLILGVILISSYFLLRNNYPLMVGISENFVHPLHRMLGELNNKVRFSVAEVFYAVIVITVIIYLVYTVVKLFKDSERGKRVLRFFLTLVSAASLFYGGFCLLWGVYYYGDSFSDNIGLEMSPISVDQLESVTCYFADLANSYSNRVRRDNNGNFSESRDWILDRGTTIFRNAEQSFPCLCDTELRPKPVLFSKVMSLMGFTGFFFPFTGEANVNVDSPACMLPSTVAHELAHQRGVAKEQEANFVSVAVCLDSGEDVFIYSAALLAYTYLGNALYDADYSRWEKIYNSLNDQVIQDFRMNHKYWNKYEDNVIGKTTDVVYESFLESYGQTLGLKSYGACVDLLVAYYSDLESRI